MSNKSGMDRVADLAHHAQALKDIIKAAMSGGWHAAALQAIKHYWPQILAIACVLLLLPVILFCCLPAMLFGFGSSTDPTISAMNMKADTVKGYYEKYAEYCGERVETIKNMVIHGNGSDDTVHQTPTEDSTYEIVVSGGPMPQNWFISLHSVMTGNDLNAMTEQSVKDFVELSIIYTAEDKPTETEKTDDTESNPYDDTVHEPPKEDESEAPSGNSERVTKILTIQYLTPSEFMSVNKFSDSDQNWAQLMFRTLSDAGHSSGYGGNIVEVAISQVGNTGGQPYWSWYGFDYRVEWCACFVSWCANECGYIDAGIIPKFAGCIQGSDWFKERGQWQDGSYTPSPGDIIFFDWSENGVHDGLCDHVGIVEKVENGRVHTIEGNSGDACRQNSYSIGAADIYGYGLPDYPVTSADTISPTE